MERPVQPVLKALVISPDEALRRALCARLVRLGHRSQPMGSSAEAAAWLASGMQADVVLAALPQPAPDLAGDCARLRARTANAGLPVLLLLPAPDEAQRTAALEGGADDCLAHDAGDALLAARLGRIAQACLRRAGCQARLQRQRAILDHIGDAVFTADADGRVVEANRAALRRFGAPAGGPFGQPLEAVLGLGPGQLGQADRLWLRGADGRGFWAQASGSRWAEAGRARTTWVLHDLTEALRHQRLRDEFLAGVSHELRTPLTSVLGAVGLLASGVAGRLPDAAQPLVAAAQRNGERLGRLIDDVLDLTKLEGDRLPLHCRPQPLAPLASEAVNAAQAYAARAGVQLALRCPPAASADAARWPAVDADRLLQVLANLISNAVKHSCAGQTVHIALMEDADGQRIEVSDRGSGVPAAFRPQLFEKFAQAEGSVQHGHGGTGLGLHLARLLVQRMGGRIGYAPGAGDVGSTFHVWFPTATATAPAGSGAAARTGASS